MTSPYRGQDSQAEMVPVARRGELPPGRMKRFELDGRDLLLLNLDGTYYALDNACPHNGGPLSQGSLDAAGCKIVCPRHAWSWNVETGRAVAPPVDYRVATYRVAVRGDIVLVNRRPG